MKIESSYTIFLVLLLIFQASQRSVNFTTMQISPYDVDHRWGEIVKVLEGPPITQLIFKNVLVCDEGLKRILNKDQVSGSLKSLYFEDVVISEQMMKTLWQNPLAYSLTNLTLKLAAIQDEDLKMIDPEREINIESLSLEGDFISALGIQYLSKLKLNRMQSLTLYDTSLVTGKAVDHLLAINLANLKQLNIGFTAVSENNALRILNSLNLSKLTYLNISKNDFNADFYRNFSSLNFTSLQTLDLSDLLIDEDGVKHLKDMRFPNLTTLSIGGNQFFIEGLYTFINKKNFPKLNQLTILNAMFDTSFFSYFVKQFQQTTFHTLKFVGRGIEPEVLQHLKYLNLSQIKKFTLPLGFMRPTIVQNFFKAQSFSVLEELKIQLIVNAGGILNQIMEKNWPRLKILRLGRIGRINFTAIWDSTKEIKFPELQRFAFDARSLNNTELQKLIMAISRTWVKLIHLQIIVRSPESTIRALAQGLLSKIEKQILISLRFYSSGDTIQEIFKFMVNPGQKHTVFFFNHHKILQSEFKNHYSDAKFQAFVNKPYDKFYQAQKKEYFQNFNYAEIEHFEDKRNCSFLAYLVHEFEKNNKSCIMNVRWVQLDDMTNQCYNLFNKCLFPHSKDFRISFNKTFASNSSDFILFPRNISQIYLLVLENQNNIPNYKIQQMFERQQFISLFTLAFSTSDMRSSDFQRMLVKNPLLRRVRSLYIIQAFINNLTFITESNMKLKRLDLTAQLIGDDVYKLSDINFEFLKLWRMAGAGLTNENFLAFLSKLPKNQTFAFPRLQELMLQFNQIETEGNEKLFQAGLPMLNQLNMVRNKDPEIINTMLGSEKSHRLSRLAIYQNDENSIDSNLNIKNARQLKLVFIQTAKLQQTDFKALSKMDFHSLQTLAIQFNQIFQCQSLNSIKKIASAATKIVLDFKQDAGAVNSSCLSGQAKSDENLKHLSIIQISSDNAISSNFRNFFDLLIFDQILQVVYLRGVYPTQKSMRRLALQANLDYLQDLQLMQNDLKDQMIQQILNRDFRQLENLFIGWNPDLTANAIIYMRNRIYPQLKNLDVSRTSINDTGLEIILSCKFPSLNTLTLSSMQISGALLSNLSNLEAPNLNTLDLSNNELKFQDLAKFNTTKFPYLQKIMLLPFLSSEKYEKLSEIYNQGRKKSERVIIVANILNIEANSDENEFYPNSR